MLFIGDEKRHSPRSTFTVLAEKIAVWRVYELTEFSDALLSTVIAIRDQITRYIEFIFFLYKISFALHIDKSLKL